MINDFGENGTTDETLDAGKNDTAAGRLSSDNGPTYCQLSVPEMSRNCQLPSSEMLRNNQQQQSIAVSSESVSATASVPLPTRSVPSSSWGYGSVYGCYPNNPPPPYDFQPMSQRHTAQKCSVPPQYSRAASTSHPPSMLRCCDPRCQFLADSNKCPTFAHSNKPQRRRYKAAFGGDVASHSINSNLPYVPQFQNDLANGYNNHPPSYNALYQNSNPFHTKHPVYPSEPPPCYYSDANKSPYWNRHTGWPKTSMPPYQHHHHHHTYVPNEQVRQYSQKPPPPPPVPPDYGRVIPPHNQQGVLFNSLLEYPDKSMYDMNYIGNEYYPYGRQHPSQPSVISDTFLSDQGLAPNNYCSVQHFDPSAYITASSSDKQRENLASGDTSKTKSDGKNRNIDVREFLSTWGDDEIEDETSKTAEGESGAESAIILGCTNADEEAMNKTREKADANQQGIEYSYEAGSGNIAIMKMTEDSTQQNGVGENKQAEGANSKRSEPKPANETLLEAVVGSASGESTEMKRRNESGYENIIEMTERLVNTVDKFFSNTKASERGTYKGFSGTDQTHQSSYSEVGKKLPVRAVHKEVPRSGEPNARPVQTGIQKSSNFYRRDKLPFPNTSVMKNTQMDSNSVKHPMMFETNCIPEQLSLPESLHGPHQLPELNGYEFSAHNPSTYGLQFRNSCNYQMNFPKQSVGMFNGNQEFPSPYYAENYFGRQAGADYSSIIPHDGVFNSPNFPYAERVMHCGNNVRDKPAMGCKNVTKPPDYYSVSLPKPNDLAKLKNTNWCLQNGNTGVPLCNTNGFTNNNYPKMLQNSVLSNQEIHHERDTHGNRSILEIGALKEHAGNKPGDMSNSNQYAYGFSIPPTEQCDSVIVQKATSQGGTKNTEPQKWFPSTSNDPLVTSQFASVSSSCVTEPQPLTDSFKLGMSRPVTINSLFSDVYESDALFQDDTLNFQKDNSVFQEGWTDKISCTAEKNNHGFDTVTSTGLQCTNTNESGDAGKSAENSDYSNSVWTTVESTQPLNLAPCRFQKQSTVTSKERENSANLSSNLVEQCKAKDGNTEDFRFENISFSVSNIIEDKASGSNDLMGMKDVNSEFVSIPVGSNRTESYEKDIDNCDNKTLKKRDTLVTTKDDSGKHESTNVAFTKDSEVPGNCSQESISTNHPSQATVDDVIKSASPNTNFQQDEDLIASEPLDMPYLGDSDTDLPVGDSPPHSPKELQDVCEQSHAPDVNYDKHSNQKVGRSDSEDDTNIMVFCEVSLAEGPNSFDIAVEDSVPSKWSITADTVQQASVNSEMKVEEDNSKSQICSDKYISECLGQDLKSKPDKRRNVSIKTKSNEDKKKPETKTHKGHSKKKTEKSCKKSIRKNRKDDKENGKTINKELKIVCDRVDAPKQRREPVKRQNRQSIKNVTEQQSSDHDISSTIRQNKGSNSHGTGREEENMYVRRTRSKSRADENRRKCNAEQCSSRDRSKSLEQSCFETLQDDHSKQNTKSSEVMQAVPNTSKRKLAPIINIVNKRFCTKAARKWYPEQKKETLEEYDGRTVENKLNDGLEEGKAATNQSIQFSHNRNTVTSNFSNYDEDEKTVSEVLISLVDNLPSHNISFGEGPKDETKAVCIRAGNKQKDNQNGNDREELVSDDVNSTAGLNILEKPKVQEHTHLSSFKCKEHASKDVDNLAASFVTCSLKEMSQAGKENETSSALPLLDCSKEEQGITFTRNITVLCNQEVTEHIEDVCINEKNEQACVQPQDGHFTKEKDTAELSSCGALLATATTDSSGSYDVTGITDTGDLQNYNEFLPATVLSSTINESVCLEEKRYFDTGNDEMCETHDSQTLKTVEDNQWDVMKCGELSSEDASKNDDVQQSEKEEEGIEFLDLDRKSKIEHIQQNSNERNTEFEPETASSGLIMCSDKTEVPRLFEVCGADHNLGYSEEGGDAGTSVVKVNDDAGCSIKEVDQIHSEKELCQEQVSSFSSCGICEVVVEHDGCGTDSTRDAGCDVFSIHAELNITGDFIEHNTTSSTSCVENPGADEVGVSCQVEISEHELNDEDECSMEQRVVEVNLSEEYSYIQQLSEKHDVIKEDSNGDFHSIAAKHDEKEISSDLHAVDSILDSSTVYNENIGPPLASFANDNVDHIDTSACAGSIEAQRSNVSPVNTADASGSLVKSLEHEDAMCDSEVSADISKCKQGHIQSLKSLALDALSSMNFGRTQVEDNDENEEFPSINVRFMPEKTEITIRSKGADMLAENMSSLYKHSETECCNSGGTNQQDIGCQCLIISTEDSVLCLNCTLCPSAYNVTNADTPVFTLPLYMGDQGTRKNAVTSPILFNEDDCITANDSSDMEGCQGKVAFCNSLALDENQNFEDVCDNAFVQDLSLKEIISMDNGLDGSSAVGVTKKEMDLESQECADKNNTTVVDSVTGGPTVDKIPEDYLRAFDPTCITEDGDNSDTTSSSSDTTDDSDSDSDDSSESGDTDTNTESDGSLSSSDKEECDTTETELLNKEPRLKVQIPWDRIFNSNNDHSTNKEQNKSLDFGPAKVQLHVSVDSNGLLKVIDKPNTCAPVSVNVRRLIFQKASSPENKGIERIPLTDNKPIINDFNRKRKWSLDSNDSQDVPKIIIKKTSTTQYESYLRINNDLQPIVLLERDNNLDQLAAGFLARCVMSTDQSKVNTLVNDIGDYDDNLPYFRQNTNQHAASETADSSFSELDEADWFDWPSSATEEVPQDVCLTDSSSSPYPESDCCELHHCLLCHRSYPTEELYRLHIRGRFHKHVELVQRKTIHAMYRHFTGYNCPYLRPLTPKEKRKMRWRPKSANVNHYYHQKTPLQVALQKPVLSRQKYNQRH